MEIVVSDSSTLILLVKSEIINELLDLVTIIIPSQVYHEIKEGKRKQKPDAFVIDELIEKKSIKIKIPKEEIVKSIEKLYNLDKGELYAIALAKELNTDIWIDDKEGMLVCKKLYLNYFTAMMVLSELYLSKKIKVDKAKKSLELLIKCGWYKKEEIEIARKKIEGSI
jgi:predicted nucleic acid-binding protein